MPERYEFLRKIAQGGFGRVYVAKDTRLGREVAIKRLLSREESASFELAHATFEREATTLAAMQHPNIVQIYDFDHDEEGTFVVMEMLSGETLKDRLNRGPLTWDTFVMVARQALDAINAAHSTGILHRDLKPENLFLQSTPSGTRVLKILDFGLAKLSNVPSRQTMDQSGNVFGSIYYMAPEQFMRQPLDGRTDLYALGCVFYQALTGKFAFMGEDMQGNMEAHMEHQVKPIRERRPDLSAPVCDWLMRLISFSPQDRPPDAMSALRELEAALEGKIWQPAPKKPTLPPITSRPVPPLRHPARMAAGQPTSRPSNPPTSRAGPPSGTRPSGAEPAAGAMQNRAVSAVEAGRAEAKAKQEAASQRKRLALKIGIPLGVVTLLGVAALTYSRSKSNTTSASATTQPAPAPTKTEAPKEVAKKVTPPAAVKAADPAPAQLPEIAPLALPVEGLLVWRFRAGAESRHKNANGKMEIGRLHSGQAVHAWGNVASADHSAVLSLAEGKADRWPVALVDDVKDVGTGHTFFYFLPNAGMEVRLKAAELGQAPGSATSDPQGVTMAAVFRANGRTKEMVMRPLLLTGPNPKHAFSLHFDHRVGQYWVVAEREGETVQCLATVKEFATRKGGAGGSWVVAVASWDSKQGTVNLRVRSPDGKTVSGPETPIAKGMAAFDRMGVGFVNVPKESKLNPDETFDGDIMEIAVYRRALDAATQDKLLGALWNRYFKKRT